MSCLWRDRKEGAEAMKVNLIPHPHPAMAGWYNAFAKGHGWCGFVEIKPDSVWLQAANGQVMGVPEWDKDGEKWLLANKKGAWKL